MSSSFNWKPYFVNFTVLSAGYFWIPVNILELHSEMQLNCLEIVWWTLALKAFSEGTRIVFKVNFPPVVRIPFWVLYLMPLDVWGFLLLLVGMSLFPPMCKLPGELGAAHLPGLGGFPTLVLINQKEADDSRGPPAGLLRWLYVQLSLLWHLLWELWPPSTPWTPSFIFSSYWDGWASPEFSCLCSSL